MTTTSPEKPTTSVQNRFETAVLRPKAFEFGEVPVHLAGVPLKGFTPAPSLGPLANFTGTFTGSGFNTIFRPQGTATPTFPPPLDGDNVLELNLTSETLSFSKSLGKVPNRGMVQADAFLNGVPYLQTINDVNDPHNPVGIHLEPGLWVIVPTTGDPQEGQTVVRMASIPHGTTINAQGTFTGAVSGPPDIPPVNTANTNPANGITPFTTGSNPPALIRFPSQQANNNATARLPQDLTSFIAAGTITQDLLDNPNLLLKNHIASQKIVSTITINVSTNPTGPLFGGGVDNIAFLLGDAQALINPRPAGPNAQTTSMQATFWIETVESTIEIPVFMSGHPPLTIAAQPAHPDLPGPRFLIDPPIPITQPRKITVTSTQIQYSQTVFLNFNTLTWPHVSVATLVPADPVPVPPTAW